MKILVVEDEPKLNHAIQRALVLQKNTVETAFDGEAGLDLALNEEFDLIILDLMMPKLDGLTVCKKLRQAKKHTPVLILTAKGQITDKVTGLDVGADDYMVKPFAFEELFARIRALVRRNSDNKTTVLTVRDLTLDSTTFVVKRNNQPIQLSAKEFAILEYLMRHKNTILSKEQIVDHVWTYDSATLPSTVEVHIKHLRDKVDKIAKTKLIHTIRGFGYEIRD